MADINDFKLVNIYSKKMFERIKSKKNLENLSENDKARLGFYILVLKLMTGNNEVDELQESIIDTEFVKLTRGEKNNDYGIDAVYIDDENNRILLFNFKFRETFRPYQGGKQQPVLDTTKFLNTLSEGNFEGIDTISKEKMEAIYERFSSEKIWDNYLYIVSNENMETSLSSKEIETFISTYGLKIKNIRLDDIKRYLNREPKDISCKFLIDENVALVYEKNKKATSKSYLVKMNIATLIRITCDSEDMRVKFDLEADSEFSGKLKDINLENSVLYDNVRGYLGDTKFNKNIINTLKEHPENFFMYNNGITITAKKIKAESKNGNKKLLFDVGGMQIVNGGQTLRSVYEFKKENFDIHKLSEACVLVRIFQTEGNDMLVNEIAEYTNSQNAISSADLKSLSHIQIEIEKYLEARKIEYIRKAGDVNLSKSFEKKISKERLAQIIYSYKGYPNRASNQKAKLFEEYYDEIFGEIDFEQIYKLIELYFEIERAYRKSKYNDYPQKIFYIIYLFGLWQEKKALDKMKDKFSIEEIIELVEDVLKGYRSGDNLSDSRKLIQKGFKTELDNTVINQAENI